MSSAGPPRSLILGEGEKEGPKIKSRCEAGRSCATRKINLNLLPVPVMNYTLVLIYPAFRVSVQATQQWSNHKYIICRIPELNFDFNLKISHFALKLFRGVEEDIVHDDSANPLHLVSPGTYGKRNTLRPSERLLLPYRSPWCLLSTL